MQNIINWIIDHIPTWCAICQYVGFKKNMHHVPMTIGRAVPLCPDCYAEHFRPFSARR